MIKYRLNQVVSSLQNDGIRPTARKIRSALKGDRLISMLKKRDVIGFYEGILGEDHVGDQSSKMDPGGMVWLVPDFTASSGGHINIFRMMRYLKASGFPKQHVVVQEPHRWNNAEEAQDAFDNYFGSYGITVSLGVETIPQADFLVATGWQTAYWVSKYKGSNSKKLYFVQDFEPYFYAHSSEYYLAENTYKLGLTGITAGGWLAEKLSTEYGMKTCPYSFGCDTSLYKPYPKRKHDKKHIFFYARPVTPRRCFEVALMALNNVCAERDDIAVIFAGWDISDTEIPFHHLNAGSVPVSELPDLYSQCDVALVLSATNLSLLPLEVAACGCPVVLNSGPNADWLLSRDEAFYCEMDVESITNTLLQAIDDRIEAERRAQRAMAVARAASWEEEAVKVAQFLRGL